MGIPPEPGLADAVAAQHALNRHFSKQSLAYFLNQIIIPSSPTPRRFGDCADPWQRALLAPKIPAFEYLCGRNPWYAGPMRFMSILARGHNKSSLEAWLAVGTVLSSARRIHGYVVAADRDQGRLILQAVEDLLGLNEWLAEDIAVTKDVVTGPAGDITVLPCDARSAMGLRGNLYILDEIVHWKRDKEWTAIVSGLRKVTPTLVAVLSNAGLEGSWQHEAFEIAKSSPDWCVFHRPGTLASWLDPKGIAEDRRLFPPSEGDRLFDNRWIDPAAEHDYLRRTEVERCAALGASLDLMNRVRREYGVDNYVAAIDYGPRRDRTVLVVVHLNAQGQVIIDRMDVWQGTPAAPIQVQRVDDWVRQIDRDFRPRSFVIDPYQMEGTCQWMEREGLPVERFASRAGAANFEMAQCLRALIVDCKLLWSPNAGAIDVEARDGSLRRETFADELVSLRVKRMPYGYRFDHENQKHDDRAVAVGMAALKALQFPPTGVVADLPSPPSSRKPVLPVTDGTPPGRLSR